MPGDFEVAFPDGSEERYETEAAAVERAQALTKRSAPYPYEIAVFDLTGGARRFVRLFKRPVQGEFHRSGDFGGSTQRSPGSAEREYKGPKLY